MLAYLEPVAVFLLFMLGVAVSTHPEIFVPAEDEKRRRLTLLAFFVLGLGSLLLSIGRIEQARVDVSSGPSLNPSNPFDTPFELSNENDFAITNVATTCDTGAISWTDNVFFTDAALGLKASSPIPAIGPHEKRTIGCFAANLIKRPKGAELKGADIAMTVRFEKPFLFFFRRDDLRRVRFSTIKDSDGAFTWIPPIE